MSDSWPFNQVKRIISLSVFIAVELLTCFCVIVIKDWLMFSP